MTDEWTRTAETLACSDQQYFDMPQLSRTEIMRACRGDEINPSTKSHVRLGTLVHGLVFQGEEWAKANYVVHRAPHVAPNGFPDYDYRLREAKSSRDQIEMDTGRSAVKPSMAAMAKAIAEKVKSNPSMQSAFNGIRNDVLFETTIYGTTPWSEGVAVKTRADMITDKAIIDLKVTNYVNEKQLSSGFLKFGYHLQTCFLNSLWLAASGRDVPVVFFCVNSDNPNIQFFYKPKEHEVEYGRAFAQHIINYSITHGIVDGGNKDRGSTDKLE